MEKSFNPGNHFASWVRCGPMVVFEAGCVDSANGEFIVIKTWGGLKTIRRSDIVGQKELQNRK